MIRFPALSSLFRRTRDYLRTGFLPWHVWGLSPQFNEYSKDVEKLAVCLSNPALLKVIMLQCDLFSQAKVYVYNKKGVEQPDDPAIKRLTKPNPMQTQTQWLWDFMFWKMLGNAHLYVDSEIVERENAPLYWLTPQKIDWPASLEKEKDKLIFSQAKLKRLLETEILYRYEDGSVFRFPLSKLKTVNDLTNGTGNWFKGSNRIDALYKVITNSEIALDSQNINLRYAGKFLVAGQQDPKDVTKKPMSNDEKESIERNTDSDEKNVHAVKSMVDIKRFVEDLKVLELDKAYLGQFFIIGNMYNIPRDVLELYVSATYENQEKARAGHVSYTLEPAAEALGNLLAETWNYADRRKIVLSWDHLPFTQVFERERAAIQQTKAQVLTKLLSAGLPLEEINIFLDTNFTKVEKPEAETQSANA